MFIYLFFIDVRDGVQSCQRLQNVIRVLLKLNIFKVNEITYFRYGHTSPHPPPQKKMYTFFFDSGKNYNFYVERCLRRITMKPPLHECGVLIWDVISRYLFMSIDWILCFFKIIFYLNMVQLTWKTTGIFFIMYIHIITID